MRYANTFLLPIAAALLLVSSATALAAGPASPAIFPPTGKPPLAPPPITDLSRAYDFRTEISGDPECRHFADEADAVFLDGALKDEAKIARLKAISAQARASRCLTSAATR